MRPPRAFLAACTAAALVAGLGSGALAAPGDDDGAHVWPAPAPGAATPGAETSDGLAATVGGQAALSGEAALALTVLNDIRAKAGAPALVADAALTSLAQDWTQTQAAQGAVGYLPDGPSKVPPGYRGGGEIYITMSTAVAVADLVATAAAHDIELVTYPALTHVGIGYATDGKGNAYFYALTLAYDFRDVPPSDTFWPDILFLSDSGVTTGYPDGTFRPLGSVTREATAAFLYRLYTGDDKIPACDAATARRFTDVTATHPFCGAIEWLATQGIATGWTDGTFRPGEPVTREAMAAFLYRYTNVWNETPPTPLTCDPAKPRAFADVTVAHPFCGAIEWLAAQGISTGWSDKTFRPGLTIERQAMAAFLHRLDQKL